MRPEFLEDGKFSSNAVVTEVRARRLSRAEIKQFSDDPEMQAEFFGDLTPYVRPQKEWDDLYLEQLSCISTGECFNVDYLLYLDEVTDYVAKAPYRKMKKWSRAVAVLFTLAGIIMCPFGGKWGIAGVLLILAGIIVWILTRK